MSWTSTRAKLAGTLSRNPDADVTELRRELRAERAADYIRELVDSAPPLTELQRARLAALLLAPARDAA